MGWGGGGEEETQNNWSLYIYSNVDDRMMLIELTSLDDEVFEVGREKRRDERRLKEIQVDKIS